MSNPRQPARLYLKRGKGRAASYIIIDGKSQRGTGCLEGDVECANKALQAYLAETYRPDTTKRDLAAIGCADVMMMYFQDVPANSPSRATIGYHMKALEPFWGDKTLADVKGSTCRAYVAQRPVKARTARHELKALQTAINHWHKESPLVAVPKVTLPKVTSKRERVLERKEVAAMLWACRKLKFNHVARFILIGIYTGTRHAAILKLRWVASLDSGHVDLERGIIYRRGSAVRETNKRRPPVKFHAKLAYHLKQYFDRDSRTGNPLHVIHFNGQPITKMKRAWATAVKEAGLGPDVTPHVLRHTCASWLLWEGKTIWEVAGVIGADASTVERVYGHHRKIEQDKRKLA
jgi:integrase